MDELQERIADDERHAEKMRKAADYDRLAAELDAAHAELETVSTAHDIMADAYNALSTDFAALRAAGEWRPVEGRPPTEPFELKLICEITENDDDALIYTASSGAFVTYWRPRADKRWRPLPPAPDEVQP
jgi:hypothetical protein